jgi:histidine ammonia-lyase
MTVVLTGFDLTVDEVLRVARDDAPVQFDRAAIKRMQAARKTVDRSLARNETVYGMNTGVAAKKKHKVDKRAIAAFNRLLIDNHRVGQGPFAPRDVVRATLLRMANAFARGTTTASPELGELLLEALREKQVPDVRVLGSVGVSDLAPNADLAYGIVGDYPLKAGEALALLNNGALTIALSTLAMADASNLLAAMEVAGALDLEAFGANLTIIEPAVSEARPFRGHRAAAKRLRDLLAGSWLHGNARNLQDPLTFRGMPQLLGAARDALQYVLEQLAIELNAANDNPLVIPREDRIISCWNGEIAGLAAALDWMRIALAPAITSATERLVKLLQAPLSGLPGGLTARAGLAEDGLAEYGVSAQGIAAEARLLAMPVSFELASSTQAEGIEDRTTMAPLAARRLAEMVVLGERICAIELLVAAQAIDLRRKAKVLGRGTGRAYGQVRGIVGFTREGAPVPAELEPLRALVRSGRLGAGRKAF